MGYRGLSLDGKCALVFGGTTGLGRAMSLGLAEAGAEVVAVSRREDAVRNTAEALRALGRWGLELKADITRREDIQSVIRAVLQEFGRIDILINSAAVTKRVPSLEMGDEDFDRIVDINVRGTWQACQMVGRIMCEQQQGRIINIASVAGLLSAHEVAVYCASKGAVIQITRALAAEWAKYNVTVNTIAPGVFETDLNKNLINEPGRKASIMAHTPLKRFGNLEEIKGAAIFLASESSSFVTGQVLCVDGGFSAQGVGE